MLVLTRWPGEEVVMTLPNGDQIVILFMEQKGRQTRFGIEAPKYVAVDRREVYERKLREQLDEPEADAEPNGNKA